MDVYKAIRERRSSRLFKKEPIPQEELRVILDAGRWAPTGCNKQLFETILIEDLKLRRQVARLSNNQTYFYQAPVVLLMLYDESKELVPKGVAPDVPAISSGAFVQNMLLQAHALGIGSLVVSAITKKKKLRQLLNIPNCYEPMCFVFLGYPDEEVFPPPRREIDDFVHLNKFGNLITGRKRLGALYPNSPDPKKWTWEEYAEFKKRIIHYAGPTGIPEPVGLNSLTSSLIDIVSMRMNCRGIKKTLDLFPSEGLFLRSLAWRIDPDGDVQLFAVELSQETAEYVEHMFGKDGIRCQVEALKLSQNNDVAFPFEKESFDGVTCFFRLENVPNRLSILREVKSVLRDDGVIFVAFLNRLGAFDIIHRLISLNKPNNFNKRWHWLSGPWCAPPKKLVLKEIKQAGFQTVACYQFYDLPSLLRIGGASLLHSIGFGHLSEKASYSGFVKNTGLLPSIVLVEAQKKGDGRTV